MTPKTLTNDELQNLARTSAYTIQGCVGDLNDWITGYNDLLAKEEIGTPKQWYLFTGKQMNETFNLTGKRRYKTKLTFLAFSLDGLDVGKLAMFRLCMLDRWFDDIVDNNAEAENRAA